MQEAIEVLKLAVARSNDGKQDGPDVRLALKTLQFCGIPREACRWFWESAITENEIGRGQNMTAALNRIVLFKEGKLP